MAAHNLTSYLLLGGERAEDARGKINCAKETYDKNAIHFWHLPPLVPVKLEELYQRCCISFCVLV